MKKINNCWTDDNNNRWDCNICTELEATAFSKTLVNCSNCRDCSDCRSCSDCSDCRSCSYCSDCSYCRSCSSCSYCRSCSDCKTSPQMYLTALIGSRKAVTVFYLNEGIIHVVCGCWKSNLEDFEKRVKSVYGEGNKHGINYLKEIEKVKNLWEKQ